MAKKYSGLRARMSPEARALAEQKTQAMIAEIEQEKKKEATVSFIDDKVLPFSIQANLSRQIIAGA